LSNFAESWEIEGFLGSLAIIPYVVLGAVDASGY
jgi:hypothetical protein